MFRLKPFEYEDIRDQAAALHKNPSSQNVMISLPQNRTDKYLPYAFTEQGVAMLSGVLRSPIAIKMNIAIMRAFVEVRKALIQQKDLRAQVREIKRKLGEHDGQLSRLYEAIENLLDEQSAERKWDGGKEMGWRKGNGMAERKLDLLERNGFLITCET